ncbi:MAG: hypothetical protein ACXVYI_00385 [Mycobacterium sp.]
MRLKAAFGSVRNGQRRVLRLQRRLWLAEMALWPTAILAGILLSAGAFALLRRKSRDRHAGTVAPTAAPVDAPEPAVAAPASDGGGDA